MANLIVCCDGTWNTPDQREDGLPAATNVVKIYRAVAPKDGAGVPQKLYYHAGVGTDGDWLDRMSGAGLGRGLDDNIKSAYKWLAQTYTPDDRIWLFGFSRGAYTARCVAGMISACGLLDLRSPALESKALWQAVSDTFDTYRTSPEDRTPTISTKKRPFFNARPHQPARGTTPVHFLGVWDTVGSLGIPDYLGILNLLDRRSHEFHDSVLSETIHHARHAVAIDERRESFLPTLWANAAQHRDARQIWFPGVHGDVGGGYARSELSDGALLWMIHEAEAQGLTFRPGISDMLAMNGRGVMHNSLTGLFRNLQTRPRPVPFFDAATDPRVLHESAFERFDNPGLGYPDYWAATPLPEDAPVSFDVYAADPWNYTGLYLRKGRKYRFTASGEWLDRHTPCGPAGMDDGVYHGEEVVHSISSLLSHGEALLRRVTNNRQAEFTVTRRQDDMPWFCLVAALANGGLNDGSGGATSHETYKIGSGATIEPQADGYLYCFANDAWSFYGNNRGSVHVTVEALPVSG